MVQITQIYSQNSRIFQNVNVLGDGVQQEPLYPSIDHLGRALISPSNKQQAPQVTPFVAIVVGRLPSSASSLNPPAPLLLHLLHQQQQSVFTVPFHHHQPPAPGASRGGTPKP